MSMALLIICLVSGTLSFISFLVGSHRQTKIWKRVMYVLAVILLVAAISSAGVTYWASIKAEKQLQLAYAKAAEAIVQADRAQTQITEVRTPRAYGTRNQGHVSRKAEAICGAEVRHEGIQRRGFPRTGEGSPNHFQRSWMGVHKCVP